MLFENERVRVLEVTLEPNDEEPVHHHRWPSVFVLDQIKPPIVDITPDGERVPPHRDIIQALEAWDGQGCLVVHMAPQPAGRVLNEIGHYGSWHPDRDEEHGLSGNASAPVGCVHARRHRRPGRGALGASRTAGAGWLSWPRSAG